MGCPKNGSTFPAGSNCNKVIWTFFHSVLFFFSGYFRKPMHVASQVMFCIILEHRVHMGSMGRLTPKVVWYTTCKSIQDSLRVWTHYFFIKPGEMAVNCWCETVSVNTECLCARTHMLPCLPVWFISRQDSDYSLTTLWIVHRGMK